MSSFKIRLVLGIVIIVLLSLGVVLIIPQDSSRAQFAPPPPYNELDPKQGVPDRFFSEGVIKKLATDEGVLPENCDQTFRVRARQFEFEPNDLRASVGDLVCFELISEDVTHGFTMPDFGIDQRLPPGEMRFASLTATSEGVFDFFSSVFSGAGDEKMRGTLTIGKKEVKKENKVAEEALAPLKETDTKCDKDGDGYASVAPGCAGNDCNDDSAKIHPGATEICNSRDDNCNRIVDESPLCHRSCEVNMKVQDVEVDYDKDSDTTTITWTEPESEKFGGVKIGVSATHPLFFSKLGRSLIKDTQFVHEKSGPSNVYSITSVSKFNEDCATTTVGSSGEAEFKPAAPEISPIIVIPESKKGIVPFEVKYDVGVIYTASATYTWDFGDGSSGDGRKVSHTYTKPGTYIVKVVETRASGLHTTFSTEVVALPDESEAACLARIAAKECKVSDLTADELLKAYQFVLDNIEKLDSDGDGLLDAEEFRAGTSPFNVDSDGDGFGDAIEIIKGFTPAAKGRRKYPADFINPAQWSRYQIKFFREIFSPDLNPFFRLRAGVGKKILNSYRPILKKKLTEKLKQSALEEKKIPPETSPVLGGSEAIVPTALSAPGAEEMFVPGVEATSAPAEETIPQSELDQLIYQATDQNFQQAIQSTSPTTLPANLLGEVPSVAPKKLGPEEF